MVWLNRLFTLLLTANVLGQVRNVFLPLKQVDYERLLDNIGIFVIINDCHANSTVNVALSRIRDQDTRDELRSANQRSQNSSLFFAFGSSSNQSLMDNVQTEDDRHHDVLQWQVLEEHFPPIAKLLALDWFNRSCSISKDISIRNNLISKQELKIKTAHEDNKDTSETMEFSRDDVLIELDQMHDYEKMPASATEYEVEEMVY
ncbi:hypothetical protein HDE_13892 [Halotydeus destructor]|nr:hypothetical protein HDE_13892 [Halotydeus destructor]